MIYRDTRPRLERAKWLRIRRTPRKRRVRVIHLSARLIHYTDQSGLRAVRVGKGQTYRRKTPKPFAHLRGRQRVKARKAAQRAARAGL